jgi:hypothetical protein
MFLVVLDEYKLASKDDVITSERGSKLRDSFWNEKCGGVLMLDITIDLLPTIKGTL